MSEYLADGAREMLNRAKAEKEALSTTELTIDGSNRVAFPGFPYKFEALHKKIIVAIDVYKSGYECRTCKGKGRVEIKCECVKAGKPGKRYSSKEIEELRITLGADIAANRAEMTCSDCRGDPSSIYQNYQCSDCKGLGMLLEVPDTSKSLPTTGVVVSIGNRVKLERINFKIGDRIIFGPYAGNMIPTKAGLMFKILDWNQAWTRVDGAEELGAFDFIIQDETKA